jgi:GPI ethanolamine phosphate transferase 1
VSLTNRAKAAYTHRSIWSVGFVFMGFIWPAFSWPRKLVAQHRSLLTAWAASCLATAVFPLLAVDKKESLLAM